jgi:RNA-splicing ligase RtcB
MNTKDFIRLGVPLGEATRRATDFVSKFILGGGDKSQLEEVPMAYKNIREVMAAQSDLVTVLGEFNPLLVKMSPAGERAED